MSNILILPVSLLVCVSSISSVKAGPCKADKLKTQEAIEEAGNGYVQALKEGPFINNCVRYINKKRKKVYKEIARSNNTSLEEVEKKAAEKLKEKQS